MTTSLRAKVDRTRAFEEETLYTHSLASCCHKVLIALYEHGIECDKRIVNLGSIAESSSIIEYLDHHHAREFGTFDRPSVITYTRAWSKSSKAPPSKIG